MVEAKDLVRHELIGLDVEIADSDNPEIIGTKGRVVDETRNMIVIETKDGKEKNLAKDGSSFIFTLPQGDRVRVEGNLLVARPEDRIKKKLKKW